MTGPDQILTTFQNHGLPEYGIWLDYLPTDELLTNLTRRFYVEFAVTYTIDQSGYHLFAGGVDFVALPIGAREILIKHTHPRGTPQPSIHDISWLRLSQDQGSPQLQSVILPIGNSRFRFNVNTPHIQ